MPPKKKTEAEEPKTVAVRPSLDDVQKAEEQGYMRGEQDARKEILELHRSCPGAAGPSCRGRVFEDRQTVIYYQGRFYCTPFCLDMTPKEDPNG